MKNKQKYLEAFADTILKYKDSKKWEKKHGGFVKYNNCQFCSMCKINNKIFSNDPCIPCPMANELEDDGTYCGCGCADFASYPKHSEKYKFPRRIKALRKMIKVMKGWPEKRFTKKGWKYSGKELPRSW